MLQMKHIKLVLMVGVFILLQYGIKRIAMAFRYYNITCIYINALNMRILEFMKFMKICEKSYLKLHESLQKLINQFH